MDDATKKRKQPFLVATRYMGNVCACASCGALKRALKSIPSKKRGDDPLYYPEDWSMHAIDGERVYNCEQCSGVSKRRRFFDANDMCWDTTVHTWTAVPAA